MMDEAIKDLIREGIQAEIKNQIKAGGAKITLDHQHLRDVIESGRSNFVATIRKNILETALKGRVEKTVANDAKRLMDKEVKSMVRAEIQKFFKIVQQQDWPHKEHAAMLDSFKQSIGHQAERHVRNHFEKIMQEGIDDRLKILEADMEQRIDLYMKEKGETIFTKLVVAKLNKFIAAILPWKQEDFKGE